MSASPAGGSSNQKPTPPPGAPPLRRRQPAGNPLVPRKKPIQRPPPQKPPVASNASLANKASRPGVKPAQKAQAQSKEPTFDHLRRQNDGWSAPKPAGAQEYPLFVTKKALKEGLRFHIMRLAPSSRGLNQADIDPTDQDKFSRPVTLHRRDPRQPPPGRAVKEEPAVEEEQTPSSKDAERLAQIKAERDAQRALDDAQKAPVLQEAARKQKEKQKQKNEKKGVQTHYEPRTEQQRKEAEIRYEEALPWHLEDADGKNVWVGQYEAPLSESKVALMIHNGGFRMVPLEKWYKFTPKRGAFQHMTIEEAEKVMNKKAAPSRWAVRAAKQEEEAKLLDETRRLVNGPTAIKQESHTFQQASRREKMEHDDLDLSGDEFQDDDENAGFEPDRDEEAKDSRERVRREQLGANLFGDADEGKVEKEEQAVKKEEEERKLLGKNLKKALKKRDKQFQYESDSSRDRDPFASSESESESDSDENEDDKKADKDKNGASGTSTKGSNTPQGKKAGAEAAKKAKSLKRAGSPLASDSSGTESTRKKKKTGLNTSVPASRGSTPLPGKRVGAGSTSDGEGTAGEMSDGAGGRKKKKLLGTGARGTPSGSRAGSPAAPQGNKPRASHLDVNGQGYIDPPTPQEIVDALPPLPHGVTVGNLLKVFQDRIDKPGYMPRDVWLKIVGKAADFNQKEKLLRRKP
ncbi:Rap30/74 interaction domain-containing protein [Xylariaceae sp. FL0804]|nr:Rap30/74 interaction domain-containing protein [Xylariaceae sp. FL0804]